MDRLKAHSGFGFMNLPDPEILRVVVSTDGPGAWKRPLSLAEWRAVGGGIIPPQYYILCQETSDDVYLIDVMNGYRFAPYGAPTYRQAVAGWASKFVGLGNGLFDGFGALAGEMWNVLSQSVYALAYFDLTTNTTREVLLSFGDASMRVDVGVPATGKFQVAPSSTNGAINYKDSTQHPMIVDWSPGAGELNHVGAGRFRVSTDKESVAAVWHSADDGLKGFGPAGVPAEKSPGGRYNMLAVWSGSAADTMSALGHKPVLQQMNIVVTGY